ncbi:3'-5' exonuclease [Thermodesulfobacteriota bacterium]
MPTSPTFIAIDFETASFERTSACAVSLVRVENLEIVQRETRLIRPPSPNFHFTYIHGLTWADVAQEPTFGEIWPELEPLLDGTDFLAAHNAPFDRGVLDACCDHSGCDMPDLPFICTVNLARRMWRIYPTKLPMVCERLGIPLVHHDPASDAEACARITIAAMKDGWRGLEG